MANCAVVRDTDNIVVNKIVANPDNLPPEGTYLVLIQDGVMCDIGWLWDGVTFIDPNPPETNPETEQPE
jgi:hypothetical protein